MAITYASDRSSDGAGSQVHRILGIMALAEALNVPYDHSPIIKIDYHGWDRYLSNEYDEVLAETWNRFLGFPNTTADKTASARVWNNVAPEQLTEIAEWIKGGGQARIFLPLPFLDIFPHYLEKVRPRLWAWYDSTPKPVLKKTEKLQVALHVRRGELHLWESYRMLPNKYYLTVIRQLKKILPANAEFHIHSEGNISSEQGKEDVFRSKVHFTDMQEPSKRLRKNRDRFEDFVQEGCILHINEDVFQTFHRCISADIFIMSRSSLSYVMGVYSRGIVVYQPYWSNPLPSWCVAPKWRNITSPKDILFTGPRMILEKVMAKKSKAWDMLRAACILQQAQHLNNP